MENQKSDLIDHFNSITTTHRRILLEFEKPIHQNIFFRNIEQIQLQSTPVEFNSEKWFMRPELFCKDHYSQPFLYQIILLVNNIKSVFEFIPDNFQERIIIAPHLYEIKKLLSYQ